MSYLTRLSFVIAPFAVACGPKPAPPPPTPPAEVKPTTEDLAAEIQKVPLTGTLFRPEGLPPMSLPLVRPTRRVTVDQQRATWKKVNKSSRATLAARATEAQLLASLLWEAGLRARPADRPAMIAEARAALAAVHATAAGQLDASTLELAAALALAVNDHAAATPYLDELLARFASAPIASIVRAQRAFQLMVGGDDAAAAALLAGLEPTVEAPELAYVIAWSRFRARALPGASAAIAAAIKGWRSETFRKPVMRDFLIITARAGTLPAEAMTTISALDWAPAKLKGEPRTVAVRNLHYDLVYKLSQSYGFAGRPELAVATIELALGVIGAAAQPADVVVYRLEQAEYARRAGALERVGDAWAIAKAALDACTACPVADRTAFGDLLKTRAVELHTVFATTGDPSYRDAAKTLYALFATLPERADAAEVTRYASDFAATTVPESGAQYADGLLAPLSVRLQEVAACYDEVLQGDRTVGGTLALTLEIDQGGMVSGATTEPAAGDSGLAAVGRCVEGRARAWRLPSRPRPGVARVKSVYELNPPPS